MVKSPAPRLEPRILGFDTSAMRVSLAIAEGQRCLSRQLGSGKPDECLFDCLDAALAEAGLGLADLDGIGVGLGPGVFTGTRVGLATAKALHLNSGVSIVGVCSLVAVARATWTDADRTDRNVLLDAGRGEFYGALVQADDAGAALVGPVRLGARAVCLDGRAARVVIVARDGLGSERGPAPNGDLVADLPSGLEVAREAAVRWRRGGAYDAEQLAALEPMYVRSSNAKLPSA